MQFLVLTLVRLLESGSQARDDSGQSHGLTHWTFWKERARQMEKAIDSLQTPPLYCHQTVHASEMYEKAGEVEVDR